MKKVKIIKHEGQPGITNGIKIFEDLGDGNFKEVTDVVGIDIDTFTFDSLMTVDVTRRYLISDMCIEGESINGE